MFSDIFHQCQYFQQQEMCGSKIIFSPNYMQGKADLTQRDILRCLKQRPMDCMHWREFLIFWYVKGTTWIYIRSPQNQAFIWNLKQIPVDHCFWLFRSAISGRGEGEGFSKLPRDTCQTGLFGNFFPNVGNVWNWEESHLWNSPKIHPIRQGQTLLNWRPF